MKLIEHIQGLINIYGIIHKNKVIEIYNQLNQDNITDSDLKPFLSKQNIISPLLPYTSHQDYFVKKAVKEPEQFKRDLAIKELIPFYQPTKEEIQSYAKSKFHGVEDEMGTLALYLQDKFFRERKANKILAKIYESCQSAREFETLHDYLIKSSLRFTDEDDSNHLAELIVNLAYNVRVQELNGNRPMEIGTPAKEVKKALKEEYPAYYEMLGGDEMIGRYDLLNKSLGREC